MASSSDCKVIYDGTVETENDPEDIETQKALKASMESFKEEQSDRDAAMARALAAEMSGEDSPGGKKPTVVMDGAIETENDPEYIATQQALKASLAK